MFQVKWSSRNTPGRWKYLRYFAFIIKRRSLISLVWLCNMRNDQSGSSLNSVIWCGEHLSDQPLAPTASHSNRTNLPCFPEEVFFDNIEINYCGWTLSLFSFVLVIVGTDSRRPSLQYLNYRNNFLTTKNHWWFLIVWADCVILLQCRCPNGQKKV